MATYEVRDKKAIPDTGLTGYTINVKFTDKNGDDQSFTQLVGLPTDKDELAKAAQDYADEYETNFNKQTKKKDKDGEENTNNAI